jgi:2-polyprenyl-6-methoxyphenol hydroxylase-like FAD-dependent oxidoreductase
VVYGNAKLALNRWCRSVVSSPDWAGAGILLNVVALGVYDTPAAAFILEDPERRRLMQDLTPLRRAFPGRPEDAAALLSCRFTIRDRDRALASIRFDQLPTKYPYTLMVPQQVTEAVLLARLRELGGDVSRPYVVRHVEQNDGGVSVTVDGGRGPVQAVRARYLVGADGMHSTVREQAGIGFTGDTYAQSFVLADVRMRWPLDGNEVMLFFSPEGLVVVAPLPGGQHRVVATMDDAPEHPAIDDVQRLLDTRGPAAGTSHVDASSGARGFGSTTAWRIATVQGASSWPATPPTHTVPRVGGA